jgi:hypothetical protein
MGNVGAIINENGTYKADCKTQILKSMMVKKSSVRFSSIHIRTWATMMGLGF